MGAGHICHRRHAYLEWHARQPHLRVAIDRQPRIAHWSSAGTDARARDRSPHFPQHSGSFAAGNARRVFYLRACIESAGDGDAVDALIAGHDSFRTSRVSNVKMRNGVSGASADALSFSPR